MSDAVPDTLTAGPPPRDRRIVVTAAVSVALHLALIGFVLLPRLHLPEPTEPPAVNVDLVPPEAVSSVELASSEMASSSREMPSSEMSSSDAPSSELTSSELMSSIEPPSSAEASSALASSAGMSSATSEAPSAASEPASSVTPPVPMERPIVIPVGPSAESSEETSSASDTSASEETSSVASASEEPSSAASELVSSEAASSAASETADASALTTTDAGASDAIAQASSEPAEAASPEPKPVVSGALHTAKRFYLEAMLSAPAMARARDAIKKLPPEKRLSQTCNIEAIGQLGNAGKGYNPDALVADALAKPVMADSSFTVVGGAFRSDGKWRAISYDCALSKDLGSVTSFSYRVGGDVTAQLRAKLGD
jgi:hypothetical protein